MEIKLSLILAFIIGRIILRGILIDLKRYCSEGFDGQGLDQLGTN